MTREQILTTGLSNSVGLLLEQIAELASIQHLQLSTEEKAQQLSCLHLSSIIEYCQAINSLSKQINQTLSKLILERQYVFANTQLVNDDEMLQFSGIFSTQLESLTSSIKRIYQQSLAIKQIN